MKYYLHDSNAFSDEKITMLYMKYGYEGLGLFYTALEKLAAQEKPINTEVLKAQLKVGKRLEKIFQYCESLGILSSTNGETFSKQLLNFAGKYAIKKEKNRKKVLQWRENQKDTNSVTGYVPVRNACKVNKSKVNNNKLLSDTDVSAPKSYFDFETDKAKSILECTKSADFSVLVKKSGYTLSTIILILTKRLCNKEGRDYVATGQEKKAAKELSEIMQNKKTDLIDQALLYADMITTAANTDVWRNKITASTALKYFNNIWETYKEA